jgi:hypothetical protein
MITDPLEHAGFTRLSTCPWSSGITTVQSRLFRALSFFARYFNSTVDTVPNLPRKTAAFTRRMACSSGLVKCVMTVKYEFDKKLYSFGTYF